MSLFALATWTAVFLLGIGSLIIFIIFLISLLKNRGK